MAALHDTHCHLDLMENGIDIACEAQAAGALLFSNTVTPAQYRNAQSTYGSFDNVTVGLGLHPWYVGEIDEGDIEFALAEVARVRFVGEVGLDASARFSDTLETQRRVFELISKTCAENVGRVLSIHAVKSVGMALDILEHTGALRECTCIFHWFSGTSDELTRARKAGCLFSVGAPLAATKRGRAYIGAIAPEQLLLETDAPAKQGERETFEDLQNQLKAAQQAIRNAHNPEAATLAQENARQLLSK